MNPLELFSPADSSESGLFEWLRQKISRKMLEEIAANDYSEEVSDHFAAIERQLSKDPAKACSRGAHVRCLSSSDGPSLR
jgi:hypothetical protein